MLYTLSVMKHSIRLFVVLLLLAGALQGQTGKEKKKMKEEEEAKEFAATRALVETGVFEFVADWAKSYQGMRVNLIGNPNYMKLQNGEADVYLPYFGVAHTASQAFSNEGGIVFKGTIRELRTETNDKKKIINFQFKGHAQKENLDFFLTVFANGKAFLNVNSNVRSGIRYDGMIRKMDKAEE